jgi:hypothetical protein
MQEAPMKNGKGSAIYTKQLANMAKGLLIAALILSVIIFSFQGVIDAHAFAPNNGGTMSLGTISRTVAYKCSTPLSDNTPLSNTVSPITPEEYQRMLGTGMDVSWMQFKKDMETYNPQVPANFRKKGFSHVRIRINEESPDQAFINRLKDVVNDCSSSNLIPIISFSAESFKENPTEANMEKVVHLWTTIAKAFKGYPYALSYDIIIEVGDNLNKKPDLLNECYEQTVSAIRKINPYRIIFISPINRSNPYDLGLLKIPKSANGYLMVEWHFYAAGPSKTNPDKLWTSGTPAEKKLITDRIQAALAYQKKTGLYSWVGAWMPGNYNHGNNYTISEQVKFATFMSCALREAHIPYAINADTKFYNNTTNSWIKEMLPVVNAVLNPDCGIPTPLNVKAVPTANGIYINWDKANFVQGSGCIMQRCAVSGYALFRKMSGGSVQRIATLPAGETFFLDKTVKQKVQYTYFVETIDNAWPPDYSKPSQSVTAEFTGKEKNRDHPSTR